MHMVWHAETGDMSSLFDKELTNDKQIIQEKFPLWVSQHLKLNYTGTDLNGYKISFFWQLSFFPSLRSFDLLLSRVFTSRLFLPLHFVLLLSLHLSLLPPPIIRSVTYLFSHLCLLCVNFHSLYVSSHQSVHHNGEPGWEAGYSGVDDVLAGQCAAQRGHLPAVRHPARHLQEQFSLWWVSVSHSVDTCLLFATPPITCKNILANGWVCRITWTPAPCLPPRPSPVRTF